MSEGAVAQARTGFSAAYWQVWSATAVSSVGDGLLYVALPLLAAGITHDARLVAGVAVAGRLPWLLFGLLAGAVADRAGPRVTAVIVESARMVILAGFAAVVLASGGHIVVLYALAFLLGSMDTGFQAATQAAIPSLVDVADLVTANGRMYVAESAGEYVVGPLFAGALFAIAAALPFALDGLSFAVSAILLAAAFPRRVSAPVRMAKAKLRDDVGEGLRWLAGDRLMRLVLLMIGTFAALQAAAVATLVLLGTEVLHLSKAGYGVFVAVSALGDVGGAALAGRFQQWLGTHRLLVVAGFVSGASYLLVAATTNAVVACLALAIEAVAVAGAMVSTLALRQALIPAELRGRVGNAFRTVAFSAYPLGAIAGGLVAAHWGLRAPYVVAGVVQCAVVVVLARPLSTLISGRMGAPGPEGSPGRSG